MAYTDPAGVHNPTTGIPIPATWGDAINADIIALRGDVCLLSKSATQTFADSTPADITFDEEISDPQAMHSGSNATITVSRTGIYIVSAGRVRFTAHASGYDSFYIVRGAADIIGEMIIPANSGNNNEVTMSVICKLTAGDTVKLRCNQTSGGNLDLMRVANVSPTFGLYLIYDLSA
jgi:hypothetical protein